MKTKDIMSYFFIIFGAFMASFSVACILLPNDAIDYGTAGIAIIINKLTGFSLPLCVFFIFVPFIICGAIYLGRHFVYKAIVGSLSYTIGIFCFERVTFELNIEHFLVVFFGGAVLGMGLSLILRNGGCIDGSEILANVLVKKISERTAKNYNMTGILLVFNAIVYIFVFFYIDQNSSLLSLLVYIVATSIIDHFTDHFEAIKKVTIITKHYKEMVEQIRKDLNKTCTIMDSYGAIAGENKTVVCYVNYFELQKLKEIIMNHETNPFTTVSTIDEIL